MAEKRTVAVVGLGRMGLPTASLCLQRNYEVIGIDRDEDVRACIAFLDMPYDEPGLLLRGLKVEADLTDVQAHVWIVAVGTTRKGELSDAPVVELAGVIAAKPQTELIIIESTISPQSALRLADVGVLIAHCPERARPGQVFADFATVPRLIGGVDDRSTDAACAFYSTLTEAPLVRCTAAEAALAKLAENAEREVRIAFANELADTARKLGVDVDSAIRAANSHPRAALLRPGIGVGGLCLPMATRWFAAEGGSVSAAARSVHEERPRETALRITRGLEPGAKVCVLGRTYRPDTTYHQPADGSDPYAAPAVALIAALRELGFEVSSWDPSDEVGTREEAEAGADLVYIAVEHSALR